MFIEPKLNVTREGDMILYMTLSEGCLGSGNDEERSEMR